MTYLIGIETSQAILQGIFPFKNSSKDLVKGNAEVDIGQIFRVGIRRVVNLSVTVFLFVVLSIVFVIEIERNEVG